MLAFDFLLPNYGMWWGLKNGTLSFYACTFSGGDTMRWWGHSNPTIYPKNLLELFAPTASEDAKTSSMSA